MGEVVDMHAQPAVAGDMAVMRCECDAENPALMAPVICLDSPTPLIVALVCPKCQDRLPVINGRINVEDGS